MKKAVFLAMVLASVNELIQNSSQEEKDKVDFDKLHKAGKSGCILAQMTGNYDTNRANALVKKDLFVKTNNLESIITGSTWFPTGYLPTAVDHIVPAYDASGNIGEGVKSDYVLSAFEIFIMIKGANIKDLVDYIKGNLDTFEPTYDEVAVVVE